MILRTILYIGVVLWLEFGSTAHASQGCDTWAPEAPLIAPKQHLDALVPLKATEQAARVKRIEARYRLDHTRIALVIGVADYKREPLDTPVDDARAIATEMRMRGFSTVTCLNPTNAQIGDMVDRLFSQDLVGADLFFWYSGHGTRSGLLVGTDNIDETAGFDPKTISDRLIKLAEKIAGEPKTLGADESRSGRLQGFRFLGVLANCYANQIFTSGGQGLPGTFEGSAYFIAASDYEETPDSSDFRNTFLRVLRGVELGDEWARGLLSAEDLAKKVGERLHEQISQPLRADFLDITKPDDRREQDVFAFPIPRYIDWAAGAKFKECNICPDVRVVWPHPYLAPPERERLAPSEISLPFAMSELITVETFRKCGGSCGGIVRRGAGDVSRSDDAPAVVSRRQAEEYITWLNDHIDMKGAYRLQTVAEHDWVSKLDWRAGDIDPSCKPFHALPEAEAALRVSFDAGILTEHDHWGPPDSCAIATASKGAPLLNLDSGIWEWTGDCSELDRKEGEPCRRGVLLRKSYDGLVQKDREWLTRAGNGIGFRVVRVLPRQAS